LIEVYLAGFSTGGEMTGFSVILSTLSGGVGVTLEVDDCEVPPDDTPGPAYPITVPHLNK
jgi:hypothetical protein